MNQRSLLRCASDHSDDPFRGRLRANLFDFHLLTPQSNYSRRNCHATAHEIISVVVRMVSLSDILTTGNAERHAATWRTTQVRDDLAAARCVDRYPFAPSSMPITSQRTRQFILIVSGCSCRACPTFFECRVCTPSCTQSLDLTSSYATETDRPVIRMSMSLCDGFTRRVFCCLYLPGHNSRSHEALFAPYVHAGISRGMT